MKKEIRIATESMTKELMKLDVGEMVIFPHKKYRRRSLSARPSQLKNKRARERRFVTVQHKYGDYTTVARFPDEVNDEEVNQPQGDTP